MLCTLACCSRAFLVLQIMALLCSTDLWTLRPSLVQKEYKLWSCEIWKCACLMCFETWKPFHKCHKHGRRHWYGLLQCAVASPCMVLAFHRHCKWNFPFPGPAERSFFVNIDFILSSCSCSSTFILSLLLRAIVVSLLEPVIDWPSLCETGSDDVNVQLGLSIFFYGKLLSPVTFLLASCSASAPSPERPLSLKTKFFLWYSLSNIARIAVQWQCQN